MVEKPAWCGCVVKGKEGKGTQCEGREGLADSEVCVGA